MARSVDEINISNVTNTGQTSQFPRYTLTVEVKWTKNDGTKGTYGPTQVTFPAILNSGNSPITEEARAYFIAQMCIAKARVELGIDTWDMYQ